MMKKIIFFVLIFLMTSIPAFAQNSEEIVSSEIADELCMEATKFKMKKEYCKAVEAYIKVKKMGFPNEKCQKAGEVAISAYLSQCPGIKDVSDGSGGVKSDDVLDTEKLCMEATRFKMRKEYCNAYEVYRKVKKLGYPNESCQKAAERVLNEYADMCGNRKKSDVVVLTDKSVNSPKLNTNKFIRPPKSKAILSDDVKKAIEYSENVEELCMFAVKFKIRKETCNAFWMYNMALAQNGVGDICQKQGELFLSQHADECGDAKSLASSKKSGSARERVENSADDLCHEAVKYKMKKETCKAYRLYLKALEYVNLNPTCKKQGELYVSQHSDECN